MSIIRVDRSAHLTWDRNSVRCALGRSGIVANKREGDGGTPSGVLPLRRVFYRSDRLSAPLTSIPITRLACDDGWCDDPADKNYNQYVTLPHRASCETLWRDDHLYDVIVVLGHNDDPIAAGCGSAIFLHVASTDFGPTEGCIALDVDDLLQLLGSVTVGAAIYVNPS